jgi:hypothetical protein
MRFNFYAAITEKLKVTERSEVGTPEKEIRRLDPNTANERRVAGPNAWLCSGQ